MAYVGVLCLQNKVLGNIEKFAENQGLQTFFFKEKVLQNTAKYRNRFLKWSKIGVKVERKWSKYFKSVTENGVGSGNIICVILCNLYKIQMLRKSANIYL